MSKKKKNSKLPLVKPDNLVYDALWSGAFKPVKINSKKIYNRKKNDVVSRDS